MYRRVSLSPLLNAPFGLNLRYLCSGPTTTPSLPHAVGTELLTSGMSLLERRSVATMDTQEE